MTPSGVYITLFLEAKLKKKKLALYFRTETAKWWCGPLECCWGHCEAGYAWLGVAEKVAL